MRKIFIFLATAIIALPVCGGQVDENTAREVAVKVLLPSSALRSSADATQQKELLAQKTLKLLYETNSSNNSGNANSSLCAAQADETVYFYVFDTENNEGFVIVAGDDRVVPVLSYSDTNGFSADNMLPNLKWWLGEYAKQIQFAVKNGIEPTQETKQQWEQYFGNNNNGKEK